MTNYLENIESIEDFKCLKNENLELLCGEIREFLIKHLSQTGGHLSSNLGIVELTVALHKVFESPKDKIIFDVSHQSYVHKILTGRKDSFVNLKKKDGLSGFTSKEESIHDIFDIGHTSTSISLGMGLAVSRDILKQNYNVISIIGDGALTGGEAIEGLNNVAKYDGNLIIVLNDNNMSISKNTGGIANHLNKIKSYENIFTQLGIEYIGVLDGHNLDELIETFEKVKNRKKPVIIHVRTIKGKGYKFAESNSTAYHAIGKFEILKEVSKNNNSRTFTKASAEKVEEIMEKNNSVTICPAMQYSLMLEEIEKKYPDRFFDTAIAEQHAISFAAGIARNNIRPFVFMYSTFLQRAYDQIEQDVCLNNLPVTILIDRAGIVGEDGKTHQGIYDISFLSHIPNLVYMSPKDDIELKQMIDFSMDIKKPVAIRYPKGEVEKIITDKHEKIKMKKMEIIKNGNEIAIIGLGNMYALAEKVVEKLEEVGMNPTLINPRFICPLDKDTLEKLKENHKVIITIEDSILDGGFGEKISRYYGNDEMKTINFGYSKDFISHASIKEIYKDSGISVENVYNTIMKMKI